MRKTRKNNNRIKNQKKKYNQSGGIKRLKKSKKKNKEIEKEV